MTRIVALFLVLLAGEQSAFGISPAGASNRLGNCPAAHPDAEGRIRSLLSNPLLPELRARFDFGTASADEIEPLTDERDLDTCRALWNALEATDTSLTAGDQVSFFRSGDRFFVPIQREGTAAPGATIRLDGYSSLDVYDAGYRLVGRFGA